MDSRESRDHHAEEPVMVPADVLEPSVETSASRNPVLLPSNFQDTLRDHYFSLKLRHYPRMILLLEAHPRDMVLNSDVSASPSSHRSLSSPFSDDYTSIHINERPLQNHLSRHSPPVQPNEHQPSNVGLPSFSQVLFPERASMAGTDPPHSS